MITIHFSPIKNVPQLPDNSSRGPNGNFFMGGVKRLPIVDLMQPRAFLKHQLAKIPLQILGNIPNLESNRYRLILDENGNLKQSSSSY